MSGVGFLTTVKTFGPSCRRQRRCEKQKTIRELPAFAFHQSDGVANWDAGLPITPPAAFLPPEYKKKHEKFGPG
jgi:hypothetical protein